jgi:hypothetical protein
LRRGGVAAATLSIAGAGFILGFAAAPAGAYSLIGCVEPTTPNGALRNVSFDYNDLAGYTTLSPNAAADWNARVNHARFVRVHPGGEVSAGEVNNGNNGYPGITSFPGGCTNGYFGSGMNSTNSRLNTYYGDANPGNYRYYVMEHELGHALGLDHNTSHGSCATTYLMYPTVDPYYNCGFYQPKSDDINGVNALY